MSKQDKAAEIIRDAVDDKVRYATTQTSKPGVCAALGGVRRCKGMPLFHMLQERQTAMQCDFPQA